MPSLYTLILGNDGHARLIGIALTAFPRQAVHHQLVHIAIEQSERFAISYWDAAILAAAEGLGPSLSTPKT